MPTLTLEIDSSRLQTLLQRLSNTCSDDTLDGALRVIGEKLVHTTRKRLLAGVTPEGNAFKPLSAVTLALRAKRGRHGTKPLIDTGQLLHDSLGYDTISEGLLIYVKRQGAASHQTGAKGAGRGRKVRIPRRRILGVSNDDLDEIACIVRAILSRVKRGEL
jgi:phage virion morphogenesis protein